MTKDNMRAVYVALNGTVQMGGFSRLNWDAARDRCELHLHEKTGGVFVKFDNQRYYIAPSLVSHVEMETEGSTNALPSPSSPALSPVPAALPSSVASNDSLEDQVLRELTGGTTEEPSTTKRRRRKGTLA